MTVMTPTATLDQADVRTGILPLIGAAAFGLGLLFLTGFAQASVFHNAAHDTRHAIAFPCH